MPGSKTSVIFSRIFIGLIIAAFAFGVWAILNPVPGRYGGLMTLGYLMISGGVILLSVLTLGMMALIKKLKKRKTPDAS